MEYNKFVGIIDFLFPVECLGCGSCGKYICDDCLSKVKRAKQVCIECGKPSIDGFVHTKCKRPWGLDGVFSAWGYEGVIRKSILKLKYNFAYSIAKELAENMARYIYEEFTPLASTTLLVPIPLHRSRSNWRGFNQTEEIGKIVCKNLGWGFNCEILVRERKSIPQVELRGDERKENIKGVFGFNKNFNSIVKSQKSIVLFDDVLTTGATIKEAGKVIKRNGARSVWGLTIAS